MRLEEVKPALQGKSQDFTSAQTIDTYRRWLGEKYLLYRKVKQALDIELARFQANLDHTTYRSIRSAALATGQPEDLWPGLRPELIQMLEQQGRWGHSSVSTWMRKRSPRRLLPWQKWSAHRGHRSTNMDTALKALRATTKRKWQKLRNHQRFAS